MQISCVSRNFLNHNNPKELPSNIDYIRQVLHFPYYYFRMTIDVMMAFLKAGFIIFSKIPDYRKLYHEICRS